MTAQSEICLRVGSREWSGTAQQLLLSGELPPRDFAHWVVPAPRALQSSLERRLLPALHLALVLIGAGCGIAVAVLLVVGRSPAATPKILLLITLVASVASQIVRVMLVWRQRNQTTPREIDASYREGYYGEFIAQLDDEIRAFSGAPNPVFIQSVVRDIQRALAHAGVSSPEVCILRSEEGGEYVSYYAGYESNIERGATIANLSSVMARRVVYQLPCNLGLESENHHVAVIAPSRKLSDVDANLVKTAIERLSLACKEGYKPDRDPRDT